jgi:hypothetical protein
MSGVSLRLSEKQFPGLGPSHKVMQSPGGKGRRCTQDEDMVPCAPKTPKENNPGTARTGLRSKFASQPCQMRREAQQSCEVCVRSGRQPLQYINN